MSTSALLLALVSVSVLLSSCSLKELNSGIEGARKSSDAAKTSRNANDAKPASDDSKSASQGSSSASEVLQEREKLNRLMMGPDPTTLRQAMARYMPQLRQEQFGWTDYERAANSALDDGDYESAEYLLDEAIKLNDRNGNLYYMRGRACYNSVRSNYDKALSDLMRAKGMGALKQNGYEYLAGIYDSRKQTDKAIAILSEAIALNPKEKSRYHDRAVMYVALGDKQKAKLDYDKTIALSPRDALPYLLRGQLLESMGRFDDALKDYASAATYAQASEKIQKGSLALKAQALLLSKLGRHKEAIAVIDRMPLLDRDDDEMTRLRGDQYLGLKMYEKAIEEYSKSIDMAPGYSASAFESRAKAHEALGKSEMAARDRKEAEKLRESPAERGLYRPK